MSNTVIIGLPILCFIFCICCISSIIGGYLGYEKSNAKDCEIGYWSKCSNGKQTISIVTPKTLFGKCDEPKELVRNCFPEQFLIKNFGKNNLCMDHGTFSQDGNSYLNTDNKIRLSICDPKNKNQQWRYSSKQIRPANAIGECLSSGGNKGSKLNIEENDNANQNQIFEYNQDTKLFKNIKTNLCIDDGGGTKDGDTEFRLWTCDPSSINQKFIIKE